MLEENVLHVGTGPAGLVRSRDRGRHLRDEQELGQRVRDGEDRSILVGVDEVLLHEVDPLHPWELSRSNMSSQLLTEGPSSFGERPRRSAVTPERPMPYNCRT